MNTRKAVVLAALVLLSATLWALDIQRYLTLEALQAQRQGLEVWYAENPWSMRAGFFVLYVLLTAVSFPGAVALTLVGGAVMGLGWGLLLVSFASTLGATLAFWSARTLLRDTVQKRLHTRMAEINAGLARDGVWYLLSLRLIPVVPFFAINLAMGLTTMRSGTFFWVSQLGMLPGTAVYVNAGTQLGQLHSLADVASPGLLGAFVLLGVLPLASKAVLAWHARRQVLAPWAAQRPRRFDRNLIVIGGGAAGLVSAYIGAALKAKVTLVEAQSLGGDCLNTGCVPSKALIGSAHLAHQLRHAERYGIGSGLRSENAGKSPISFKRVMQHVDAAIAAIAPHDSAQRYAALGVEVLQGYATLRTPWHVDIALPDGGVRTLSARSIVLATGASPIVPPLPGLADVGYLTSETLWDALRHRESPPARLVVLGGGPIGCELAQALARLGSSVVLVESAARLLPREDPEVSAAVHASLVSDGVQVRTGTPALRCEHRAGEKVLVLARDGAEEAIAFDDLLCAVGRTPRLNGFGLETLGIPTTGSAPTNAYLQTRFPHIYAAGDVAGPYQFTHTAAHQAWYASVNALLGGLHRFKADYRSIPSVTFVDPEVARVGLNVQEAQARGIAFEITRYGLDDLDRALCDGEAHGWVQVLTVPSKDRILGATIVGRHAGELLAEFTLAMTHGLGLNKILGTVHPYPTWSESAKYAAGAWRRAHAPEGLLRLAARWHRWRL